MVCILSKDGVSFYFTGCEKQSKVDSAIFEGFLVFVNESRMLMPRVKHGPPYCP
jgi:hypothetical protein